MKKIYYVLTIVLFIAFSGLKAQECEIALSVIVPEESELPDATRKSLANKLRQIAVQNGLGASNTQASQFAITAKTSLVNKDILPGPPMQFSYTVNVHLYIVDQFGEKIFSSTDIEVKGVGNSEQKAYADGIRKINTRHKDIQYFVSTGREKIINYYDAQYPSLLKKASSLAAMKKYNAALYEAMSIPECCKGYGEALSLAEGIYQKYLDQACEEFIASARVAWMAEQNANGATKAGEYLSQIYPDASCYPEAMELYTEIKSKVLDDWKFEMKKYDDSVSIQEQRLAAYKAIGEAYGQGQQPMMNVTQPE